jgi:peptide/nickel transport system permease protein
MRATDVMLAFPILLLAIALSSTISKPGIWVLVVVIGIVYWTPMTRVIHGEVLSIREKEFVDAARLTGCTNRRILTSATSCRTWWRRSSSTPASASPPRCCSRLRSATSASASSRRRPRWGQMISDGQDYYTSAPWLVLFPASPS